MRASAGLSDPEGREATQRPGNRLNGEEQFLI